jgi:hypothetical protein
MVIVRGERARAIDAQFPFLLFAGRIGARQQLRVKLLEEFLVQPLDGFQSLTIDASFCNFSKKKNNRITTKELSEKK